MRRQLQLELLESRRVLAGLGPEVVCVVQPDARPALASQIALGDVAPLAINGTTGGIVGRVVDDFDRDGFADLGELGVAGVTVYVDANSNGRLDVGEPFAVTQSDDLGTVGVDESGTYSIFGVMPGEYHVGMIAPAGWLQTNPALRAAGTGQLTEVQLLRDNVDGNNALKEVAGVTQSPDGNFVYIAAYADNAVTVFSRNSTTGALTQVQTVVNGSSGVAGLIGAQSIAITRDGQHLYVASAVDNALVMFSRDQSTGLLSYLGHLKQGVGGVDGLKLATAIRESADGKNLYVAAVTSNSLAVFDRDPATGLVAFAQKLTGPTTNGSFSVDLSPDQRHVYLASGASNAVNVYTRELATGHLSLTQMVTRATPGFTRLLGPRGISVSPDGTNIYVATRGSQGVVVLNRDDVTGHVSFNQYVADPFTTSNPDPVSILVSPDGHHVAVTYETVGGLAIYSRDSATGSLSLVEFYNDGVGGFNKLFGAWDIEFSNDGKSLYLVAAYDDAVYVFGRHVGDWVPASASVSISAGETTTLGSFGVANLVPMVESITYSGATPATASTIDFDVLFTEPVAGVDASDFTFVGSFSGATVGAVSGSAASYTLSVHLAEGMQGTLSPRVSFSGGIVDNEGQPLGTDGTAVFDTIDVDRQDPELLAATKLDSDPTNQGSLQYQLQFSEPVTGLDLNDLTITANGVTGGTIDSVSGSGDTYVVTISYTGGEGTIGLILVDDDSIVDVVSRPLGGIGTTSIPLATYAVQLGVIQGMVFSDLDDDGRQDPGEPGVNAMTLFIDLNDDGTLDLGEPTTTTDVTGRYSFTGLVDGMYSVRWQSQSPFVQTLPAGDAPQRVTVAVAGGISLANFGIHEVLPGSISGRVWNDLNGNGEQDVGEDGLAGVTLYVDLNLNGVFDSATEPSAVSQPDDSGTTANDETGNYEFVGLAPGDYQVRIVEPEYSLVGTEAVWNVAESVALPDVDNLAADNKSITKSPDGRFAVVFDHLKNNVIVYQLPQSGVGDVTQVQVLLNQFSDNTNKSGDLAFTPDGNYLYILESQTRLLKTYSQDAATGQLTSVSSTTIPYTYSYAVQVSPDGKQLYVGGVNHISRFDINANGSLTFVAATGGVARVQDLVFNADGTRVYVVDSGNSLIRAFSRDLTTGALSQIQVVGPPTGESFSGVFSVELSADGNDLYFVSWGKHTIWHYRTLGDGTLQHASHVTVGDSLNRTYPLDLAISDDGARVYAALSLSGAIMVLQRDSATGTLSPGEVFGTPDTSGAGINESSASMIIPMGATSVLRVNSRAASLQYGELGFDEFLDVTVSEGQSTTQNFPVQVAVTSSLAGTLWQDDNGDGVIDVGEPRLPGRTIFIDINNNGILDSGEPMQVTLDDDPLTPSVNEAGTYQLTGLAAGDYAVGQVLPVGWTQTTPLPTSGLQLLADSGYIHGVNTTTQPIYDSTASDDGRLIAFSTDKSMLPIDTNFESDIYLIDRDTGVIELISQSTSGVLANDVSRNVSISGDGRYVAFGSLASNLSSIDTNSAWDIYLRDRMLGTTTLISLKPARPWAGEIVGNSYSYSPKLSRDGSMITFGSDSSNLIVGDTNGQFDVFLRDLQTGAIERVNVDSLENQATGGESHNSQPSHDGTLVGFWSNASNLVSDDYNAASDVFLRDRQTGLTERVSVSVTGTQANGASDHFSMSGDGRYFAFESDATNLIEDLDGLSGSKQIYLKDRQSGSVTLVSTGDSGLPDGASRYPSISADGRWVTYQSAATNIVPGDTNGADDVFLYDTLDATTTMLSQSISGGAASGPSEWPRISPDGSTITFNSAATNLVDQVPSGGGLYLYRTSPDDPLFANVTLGVGQSLENNNFGSQQMVDRGDAPASYGSASHVLDPNVRLGDAVSFEISSGQPDPDDDGVIAISRLSTGFQAHFAVTTSTAGTLALWIDFDANGTFDPEERSEFAIGVFDMTTTQTIATAIPANAVLGATQARFRFSTEAASIQLPTGQAPDGEVEDYVFTLAPPVAAHEITLSNSSLNENLDTTAADLLFATLAAVDEDPGDIHSFELVAGNGDTDNARFVIAGNSLKIRQGEALDYETQSSYAVRVRATDSAGLTTEQEISLDVNNLIEISKSDVMMNDGSAQRSRVESVTIEFDTDVILQADAITIHKRGSGGETLGDLISPLPGTVGRTFTFTFSGLFSEYGSLVDGNYELRVDATKIVSTAGFGLDTNQDGITGDDFVFGDQASDKFFRYYGDIDGDRDVDGTDFLFFRGAYGKSSDQAGYDHSFDYNLDGAVNGTDFLFFRGRYGKMLLF